MKSKLENNPHENNFVRQIDDVLLFVRSTNESELSKLWNGRPIKYGVLLKPLYRSGTLAELIEQTKLEKIYGLGKRFDFNFPCWEFVILETRYEDFKQFVEKTLAENPQISFKQFLTLEYIPQLPVVKKTAGRKPDPQKEMLVKRFIEQKLSHQENAEYLAEKEMQKIIKNRVKAGQSEADATAWAEKSITEKWIASARKKSIDAVASYRKAERAKNKIIEKSKP
jgi:hypothetical protein